MQTFGSRIVAGTLLALLALPLFAQIDLRREGDLKVGGAAPDFTLKDAEAKKAVKLSELKGKPVVLIFGSCT